MLKNFFIYVMLFFAVDAFSNVEKIRDDNAKVEIKEAQVNIDSIFKEIEELKAGVYQVPDSFFIQIGDSTFYVPIQDGKVVFDNVSSFVEENKGNWPGTWQGWLFLVITTIMGAKGAQVITSGRRIYAALKPFLSNPLGLLALASFVISALITYFVGIAFMSGAFSFNLLGMITGYVALGAVFIYERWVKKDEKAALTAEG